MEAFQAAGNLVQGVAGYETGKYNRAVSRVEATEQDRAGSAERARIAENARAAMGEQVAAQGANGFQQGTGSAIDALFQSQVSAALDAMTSRAEASSRARAARAQGDMAYAAGKNSLVAGMFGAASSAYAQKADWAQAKRGTTPQAPRTPPGDPVPGGGWGYPAPPRRG